MTENVDAEIVVPEELVGALKDYIENQDRQREGNPSLREIVQNDAGMPMPPYPGADNQMLGYLLFQAQARLRAGVSPREVLINLAATAWMEGHIEGFDHGYAEAQNAS